MNTYADKTQENENQSVANAVNQKKSTVGSVFQFVDNRPEAAKQRKLQEMANNSLQVKQTAQLCIKPKEIEVGKTPKERLNYFIIYANSMVEKADNKGFKALETSERESRSWFAVSEKYEKFIGYINQVLELSDDEIPELIETLEGYLQECNESYNEVKEGKFEEVSRDIGDSDDEKEAKVEVENGLTAKINALPDRAAIAMLGVKGKKKISNKSEAKLAGLCREMIDLKQAMLEGKGQALIEWMRLLNQLLDFVENLSKNNPEDYLALIQMGIIDSITDMASMVDGGEICNEELPLRIISQLK